jgi:hypothetical protein
MNLWQVFELMLSNLKYVNLKHDQICGIHLDDLKLTGTVSKQPAESALSKD